MKSYEYHPSANLFPMMPDKELAELATDIKAQGLIHPVILLHERVLDGRNRLKACEMSGVQPRFEIYSDDRSPTEYVLAVNLKRRDLTASQRATIAANALPMLEAEARERKRGGQGGVLLPELVPEANKGDARDKAAAIVGVNPHYVSDAKAIKQADPKLFEQVASGEKGIKEAKRQIQAQDPKPKQDQLHYRPENGMKFAKMAVLQLERIHPKDKQREDAFEHVIAWINKHRKKK